MSKNKRKIILTENQVALTIKGQTRTINKKHPAFKKVLDLIHVGGSDEDLLKAIEPVKAINTSKKAANWGIKVVDGSIKMQEEVLPADIADTILEFKAANEPFEPLVKFYENCKLNPDVRVKEGLFRFLKAHRFPLTEDGCFIGYRKVANDFKDFYTGKLDFSPGQTVTLDRSLCDSDNNNTCSRGLHVANFRYAKEVYHPGSGKMINVKINPRDVVAFPTDYHFEKMRVCAMYVIGENGTSEADAQEYQELFKQQNPDWKKNDKDVDEAEEEDIETGAVSVKGNPQDAVEIPVWMSQKRDARGRFGKVKK